MHPFKRNARALPAVLTATVALGLSGCIESGVSTFAPTTAKTVRFDKGGRVVDYSLEVKRMLAEGTTVRIIGSCQSACTLYLALPGDQLCIAPGASFHFHKPYGASQRGNQVAERHMTASYPQWVNDWLSSQGGLQTRMLIMDYHYARQYVPTCGRA